MFISQTVCAVHALLEERISSLSHLSAVCKRRTCVQYTYVGYEVAIADGRDRRRRWEPKNESRNTKYYSLVPIHLYKAVASGKSGTNLPFMVKPQLFRIWQGSAQIYLESWIPPYLGSLMWIHISLHILRYHHVRSHIILVS